MPLAPPLRSPIDLFRKLEREAYRAFHSKNNVHKSDHFFNFCVTASSMRDYCLEYLVKHTRAERQPYYKVWAANAALVAAAEIANSSKHFVLRELRTGLLVQPATKAVRSRKTKIYDIYRNESDQLKAILAERTDLVVTLSDGKKLLLYAFTDEIIAYWKEFLSQAGIRIQRQPFKQLSGADA